MGFPIVLLAIIFALGCTSPAPQVRPLASTPLVPHFDQEIAVENLLIIVDTSGSIRRHDLFESEKALVQSFVRSAPRGDYLSGQIVFGGDRRQTTPLMASNHTRMANAANRIERSYLRCW